MKDLDSDHVDELLEAIEESQQISSLTLSGTGCDNYFATLIFNLLESNTCINMLDISDNELIGDNSLDALCDMIEHNSTLKTLFINGTNFSAELGMKRILQSFIQSNNTICTFIVDKNKILSEEDVERFDQKLSQNQLLHSSE